MNELIKKVAEKLDEQLDFNTLIGGIAGTAVEWVDGKILEGGLTYGVSKVPEEYKEDLKVLFEAYVNDDLSRIPASVANRVNDLVNLPGLNEQEEGLVLKAISEAIYKILLNKIGNA